MRQGFADTTFGQLYFRESGAGLPLLLLHQTPRSADEFADVQPLLAAQRRTIAMDMVGFGASPRIPAPQSIETMAAGGLALMDALGIERFAVMGHHTGGAVALEIAASAPDRVTHLIASNAPWTDADFRRDHADGSGVDDAPRASDGSHLAALWGFRAQFYPADRPDILDRFIRDALAPGLDPVEGHRACARYVIEERIGLVRAPVLLIGAEADPFAMPHLPHLRAGLTGAASVETVIIASGMIPLMEQCPQEVAAAVLEFLANNPRD
ncbi:MAG: alpha/beta fold hydrolase [Actinomycetales bacterium]